MDGINQTTGHGDSTTGLTGPKLKAIRRARGINQTRMGQLIGCTRHEISYWETKPNQINTCRGIPARMLEYLEVRVLPGDNPTPRARGDGLLLDAQQARCDRNSARINARIVEKAARYRQPCGAQTRKGHPCRNMSEAGRRRCKFHGGLSTGPKTPEGKARIAEAQRARWQAFRAVRAVAKIG
jgi:DNA-binding XRE family transcriptional regulator